MQVKVLGIDIGKSSFHVVGLDQNDKIVVRKKFTRTQLLQYTANLPACLIGMEACCGAHHLGRALAAQGHDVRLMPAEYVRPYVKSHKNDYLDAEAITEAVQRPRMRFVPLKTDEQLDLQALHRIRERLVSERTALINQVRGFLLERGLPVGKGRKRLALDLPGILEDASNNLTPRMRQLLNDLRDQWTDLDEKIEDVDEQVQAVVKESAACQRLLTIPGVGPITATALVAAIGNGAMFRRGRSLAAWLGLVPRQYSTGGKPKLLGISKRGNPYLRRLLVTGAHSVVQHINKRPQAFGGWVKQMLTRCHRNVVIVAVANKLARTAWAVLSKEEVYRAPSTAC